jgi:hypothetical protein
VHPKPDVRRVCVHVHRPLQNIEAATVDSCAQKRMVLVNTPHGRTKLVGGGGRTKHTVEHRVPLQDVVDVFNPRSIVGDETVEIVVLVRKFAKLRVA